MQAPACMYHHLCRRRQPGRMLVTPAGTNAGTSTCTTISTWPWLWEEQQKSPPTCGRGRTADSHLEGSCASHNSDVSMARLIGEDPDDSPRVMCPYSSMYLPGEFRAVPSLSYRPWGAESVMNYSGGVRPLRRTTRITRAPPILQFRVSSGRSQRSLTTMPGRNLVLSMPATNCGTDLGTMGSQTGMYCTSPGRECKTLGGGDRYRARFRTSA